MKPYGPIFVLFTLALLGGTPAWPAIPLTGVVCGEDLDGDGLVEEAAGELIRCVNGVCPMGAVDCGPAYEDARCPSGGDFDPVRDLCALDATVGCPSGYTLDPADDRCVRAVSCPEGGVLNAVTDHCEKLPVNDCPAGWFYDSVQDVCTKPATCPGGAVLNPARDRCEAAFVSACPADYVYDPAADVCASDPVCAPGVYDAPRDACRVAVARDCGSYAWDGAAGTCLQPVSCPTDPAFALSGTIAYSPALDQCVSEAEYACPSGYAYVGPPAARCEGAPICSAGVYDPGENRCYQGDEDCPLGNYRCADLGAGRNQCSANRCVNLAVNPPEDVDADLTSYQDDGAVDPATGECSGFFLVFNGNASECLPPGYQTTWFDCCDTDADNFLFIEENCGEKSVETVEARIAERAIRVGAYCKKKIRFVGCIQKADSYCLFSSKLARMIHEQGRPQLEAFGAAGGWGTAEDPNCVGFTPDEFQALDFGEIDFGEFFGDIATPSAEAIQDDMQRAIDAHYGDL